MTRQMPEPARPSLYAPFSSAFVPILNGLNRRKLLNDGATQHEVRIHNTPLNYYRWGARDASSTSEIPILLIHGLADSALTWSFIFGPLAQNRTVFAVDLPGYGFSNLPAGHTYATLDEMCDTLTAFIREVIGQPVLLVGNSMGGWLSIKLGWTLPEMVRGTVLLNPGGAPLEGRVSWKPFLDLIDVPDLRSVRVMFRHMLGTAPPPMIYLGLRGFQESFRRQVVREFVTAMQEDEFLRVEDVRNLPVPAALIWGKGDSFLPAGSFEFFRDHMDGAPMLVLDKCGHLPQSQRPREVVQFINQFAARVAV